MTRDVERFAETPVASPTVTVTGEALVRTEPDEALLGITLSALEEAPGPALADVSGRSNALLAMLDELGVAKADRSTTGISVSEEFDHTREGRRSLGHRAISRVAVRLTSQELIGRLVSQSTDALAARVDGPRWQIAPDNPVRLEAARMAAADAERKARAYAEGLGAQLGSLIRLAEPEDTAVMARRGGLRSIVPASAEAMPIEPGEHEVAASIQATFALKLN